MVACFVDVHAVVKAKDDAPPLRQLTILDALVRGPTVVDPWACALPCDGSFGVVVCAYMPPKIVGQEVTSAQISSTILERAIAIIGHIKACYASPIGKTANIINHVLC